MFYNCFIRVLHTVCTPCYPNAVGRQARFGRCVASLRTAAATSLFSACLKHPSETPPRPDTGQRVLVRRSGKGLTADVRLSTILPAIMLERWHHSSVSYSTQIQLAPQSSKLGPRREIHIQGYCTAEPNDWCLWKDGAN